MTRWRIKGVRGRDRPCVFFEYWHQIATTNRLGCNKRRLHHDAQSMGSRIREKVAATDAHDGLYVHFPLAAVFIRPLPSVRVGEVRIHEAIMVAQVLRTFWCAVRLEVML